MARLFDCCPPQVAARRKAKEAAIGKALKRRPETVVVPFLVITKSAKWPDGATIKVAFRGGNDELYRKIARAASEWSEYANITFDFRDPKTRKFHRWSIKDKTYSADIRIAFKANDDFWSAIGNESIDPRFYKPNKPSMNFDGYARGRLPRGWKGYVLHEFGHAIGLQHEHQHPNQACGWRWKDDRGYTPTRDGGEFGKDDDGRYPGIYRVLGGPPNKWSKKDVNDNIRKLRKSSSAYESGAFDKDSIMKYFFEEWMFRAGEKSPCYSSHDNVVLSAEDKRRIAAFYPRESQLESMGADAGPSIDDLMAAVSDSPLLMRELRRVRDLRR